MFAYDPAMQTTETDGPTGPSETDVPPPVRLLQPRDAVPLAGVTRRTLRRYVDRGLLTIVETLGGHARYREDEILALRRARIRTPGAVA